MYNISIINLLGKWEGDGLQFIHEDKNIENTIDKNDYDWIDRKIGTQMAKAFKKRIVQIKAANNFSIFLKVGLGNPHPLSGNLEGYYGVNLTANFRLVIKPVTDLYDPQSLLLCDTVVVKGVMDYHGGKYKWICP